MKSHSGKRPLVLQMGREGLGHGQKEKEELGERKEKKKEKNQIGRYIDDK